MGTHLTPGLVGGGEKASSLPRLVLASLMQIRTGLTPPHRASPQGHRDPCPLPEGKLLQGHTWEQGPPAPAQCMKSPASPRPLTWQPAFSSIWAYLTVLSISGKTRILHVTGTESFSWAS